MLKMQIIGNLGKDCEAREVSGKQVINFSVAHTEKYTSQGERVEKTTWVECAYWSDSRVKDYLKKGTTVYAEGTPEVRTFEKKDGTQGVSLTMRVFSVQLVGGKSEGDSSPAAPAQQSAPAPTKKAAPKKQAAPVDSDDDPDSLPF